MVGLHVSCEDFGVLLLLAVRGGIITIVEKVRTEYERERRWDIIWGRWERKWMICSLVISCKDSHVCSSVEVDDSCHVLMVWERDSSSLLFRISSVYCICGWEYALGINCSEIIPHE